MNLFSDPGTNLFDGITPPAMSSLSPSNSRQAMVAALAQTQAEASYQRMRESVARNIEMYRNNAEQFDVQTARNMAIADDQSERMRALAQLQNVAPEFDPTGELRMGAAQASAALLEESQQAREAAILERRAAERIQELAFSGDRDYAQMLLTSMEMGDAADVQRDYAAKMMIFQRELDRVNADRESQGLIADFLDFIVGAVPLDYSMSRNNLVDLDAVTKRWYDGVLAGERQRSEASALWDPQMSPEDFAKLIPDLIDRLNENSSMFFNTYNNNTEEANLLNELAPGQTPDAWVTNSFGLLDVAGLVPFTKVGRGLGMIDVMANAGARKAAADFVAEGAEVAARSGMDAATRATTLTADEIIEETMPSALNMNPVQGRVSLSGDINGRYEQIQNTIRELFDIRQPGRFINEQERQEAIKTFSERIAEDVGRPIVKDVEQAEITDVTGSTTTRVTVTLGTQDGNAFLRAQDARAAATKLGYQGAEVIQDASGGYFFKVSRDMPETGFYTTEITPSASSMASRIMLGARQLSDDFLQRLGVTSIGNRGQFAREVLRRYRPTFDALNPREAENVKNVLRRGELEGVWYHEDQIHEFMERLAGRRATSRELAAISDYRELNDIEYTIRNADYRKNLVIRGFERAQFNLGGEQYLDVNALVKRQAVADFNGHVFDVASQSHIKNLASLSDEAKAALEDKIILKLERAIELADGNKVKNVLIPQSQVKLGQLSEMQIPYRAGGHRMYSGRYFVKQAVYGKQFDKKILDTPNTYIAAMTRGEAEEWAQRMEQARNVYNEWFGLGKRKRANVDVEMALRDVFRDEPGYPTPREFIEDIEKGHFQKDTPFRVAYDREILPEYNRGDVDFVDDDILEDGFNGWLRTSGRMFYSGKGEVLRDYQGRIAQTLDPFESMNAAVRNISNVMNLSDYKIRSIESYLRTFESKGALTYPKDMPPGASALTRFMSAEVKRDGVPEALRQKAMTQKEVILRTLGWRTQSDIRADAMTRQFSEFVEGAPVVGRNLSKAVNWVAETNPIAKLRGMAFDLKLGLFNVAQFPLQIGTSLAAWTIDPKNATFGFASWLPLRAYMTKGAQGAAGERLLETFVKRGAHKAMGFESVDEFKQFMREARRSGMLHMDSSHQLQNEFGITIAEGPLTKVREMGRAPINEGETVNRAVAYRMAWSRVKERFPDLRVGSDDFLNRVAGMADDLSFNMSDASKASWQTGLASIPTQFFAYSARMLEMMFGRQLTPAEKMRLVIGQTFFFGAAGLPVVPWAVDQLKQGEVMTPEKFDEQRGGVLWMLERGAFDSILYHMTGQDVMIGERYGTGAFWGQVVEEFFGISKYGPTSTADFVFGATGSVTGQVTKTVIDLARYVAAESGSEDGLQVSEDALIRLSRNITTVNNALKAYMIHEYGLLTTGRGTILAENVPSQQAVYTMFLGAQPGVVDEISTMMGYSKNRTKAVDEAAAVIRNYRQMALKDPENMEQYRQEIQLFSRLLPPDIRRDALEKAHNGTDSSLYEGMGRRLERLNREKEILENLEQYQ